MKTFWKKEENDKNAGYQLYLHIPQMTSKLLLTHYQTKF